MLFLPVFLWMQLETKLANRIKSYLEPNTDPIYQIIMECINSNSDHITDDLNLDVDVLNRIGSRIARNVSKASILNKLLNELLQLLDLDIPEENERLEKEKERYILLFIIKNIIEHAE
jgi:hypothetical protein